MTGRLIRRFVLALAVAATLLVPAAEAQAATTQIVVKLSLPINLSAVTSLLGGTLLDTMPDGKTYLLKVPSLPILTPVLQLLGVQWIEPNESVKAPLTLPGLLSVPGTASPEWYYTQPSLQLIRANQAKTYTMGQGVTVADINSSVDYSHPALAGHLTGGYDFVAARSYSLVGLNQASASFLDQASASFLDQASASFLDQASASFLDQASASFLNQASASFLDGNGKPAYSHGTLCAGLIAAVAPRASIMPLRVFDDDGGADLFTIAKSIRYATSHGAQVINMSFGTLTNSKAIKDAIDNAASNNVTLVASAGNSNTNVAQYPASYPSVIGVAATDLLDKKASFSNYGSMVVVDAPGVNIISAFPNNQYSMVSGTSFSSPIVAGTAALVRSLKPSGIASAVTASAVKIDTRNPGYAGKLGYGRIDVVKAVHPY